MHLYQKEETIFTAESPAPCQVSRDPEYTWKLRSITPT